jgi:hypothetical protein
MPIVLGDTTIQGAASIAASGTTYGIVQDSSGRVRLPFRPRFYAYGTANNPSSGSFVVFPTTQVNVGSSYNTSNGIFTAPIAGIYAFFSANIGNTTSTVWRTNFRYNGTDIFQHRSPTTAAGGAYATNTVGLYSVSMAVNDTMRIYVTSDTGTDFYPNGAGTTNDYWYFAGYLIQ